MPQGKFSIRYARLEDASQITEIHKSHVERWYRKIGAEQYKVPYSSLSLSERWGFGGPWMSVETCSIHLNNLIVRNQFPYVASQGKSLVGEMELFLGKEGPRYGKNMHIGLLYVRKDNTGHGIGKALLVKALETAASQDCDTITVASSQSNEGFYEKCGFLRAGTLVELEIGTRAYDVDIKQIKAPLNAQSFIRGKPMPIGRYQSSAFHLFEQQDVFAIPEYMNCRRENVFAAVEGHPSMFTFVKYDSCPSKAEVYGWTDGANTGDMAFAALTLLHKQRVKYATILLAGEDYDMIADRVDAMVRGARSSLELKV